MFALLRPTSGLVLFRDTDITGFHPRDLVIMGLGYVPQTKNTFPTPTVLENLEMGAITRRISPITLRWKRGSQKRKQARVTSAQIWKLAMGSIEMCANLKP